MTPDTVLFIIRLLASACFTLLWFGSTVVLLVARRHLKGSVAAAMAALGTVVTSVGFMRRDAESLAAILAFMLLTLGIAKAIDLRSEFRHVSDGR